MPQSGKQKKLPVASSDQQGDLHQTNCPASLQASQTTSPLDVNMEPWWQHYQGQRKQQVEELSDWLLQSCLRQLIELDDILLHFNEKLLAMGVPVARNRIICCTLDPKTATKGLWWTPEEGLQRDNMPHDFFDDPSHWNATATPIYYLMNSDVHHIRRQLVGADKNLDFNILHEFADSGFTDYICCMEDFVAPISKDWMSRTGVFYGMITRQAAGFCDDDLALFLYLGKFLAAACKNVMQNQALNNVLCAYMGNLAGEKIATGNIKLGHGGNIDSVIWYSDLRNSTRFSQSMPLEEYLALLNEYFMLTAGTVKRNGGDILTFAGDSVLAIFPITTNFGKFTGQSYEHYCQERSKKCLMALKSAIESYYLAQGYISKHAQSDEKSIEFGIGLHVGGVVFGNVGIYDRMSFTVIGQAVNQTARLEEMTKKLKKPILATRAFVEGLGTITPEQAATVQLQYNTMKYLGKYELPDCVELIDIFYPATSMQKPSAKPS